MGILKVLKTSNLGRCGLRGRKMSAAAILAQQNQLGKIRLGTSKALRVKILKGTAVTNR